MGGKSSKQKIRKGKAAKGEQTQNSKEQKESTENGATATYRPLQNETATEESEVKDVTKDAAKNEDISELVQQASEESPLRNITTAESVAVSSERTPIEAQTKDDTNSPKSEEENKTESPAKETKAEAENLVSREANEELKSECSENVCFQELGTDKDGGDTDVSAVHEEELNKSSQKIEAREGESIPAPSSQPLEAGDATSMAADIEETTLQEKLVKCDLDGQEENILMVQPAS